MYWLPNPFDSFPFTSPPVRHRVPTHFNWTLHRVQARIILSVLPYTCSDSVHIYKQHNISILKYYLDQNRKSKQNFLKTVFFLPQTAWHMNHCHCYKKTYNHLFILCTYLSTKWHNLKPVSSTFVSCNMRLHLCDCSIQMLIMKHKIHTATFKQLLFNKINPLNAEINPTSHLLA